MKKEYQAPNAEVVYFVQEVMLAGTIEKGTTDDKIISTIGGSGANANDDFEGEFD